MIGTMSEPIVPVRLHRSAPPVSAGLCLIGLGGLLAAASSDLVIIGGAGAAVGYILLVIGARRAAMNVDAIATTVLSADDEDAVV